jgi:flavin-binding protein dodecin
MDNHVYKIIEITGTSNKSSDEAVSNAVSKASATINNIKWFQVVETRGSVVDGEIDRWQVTIKLGFTMN